ncbi:MAG: glycosyltransferase family 4 protein, partial [Chloroflexota bacterium]
QPARYVAEMEFSYGEAGRKEAQRILKEGLTLEKRYGLALNRRVLSAATGVIVHSEWAQRELEKLDLGVPVVRVCLGVPADEQAVSSVEKMAIRSRLGISRRASFVVASFGLVALTKRPEVLVRAFARVVSHHPSALLILVGDVHALEVLDLVDALGIAHRVLVTGYVEEGSTALDFLRAADVCVHLRYPTAGETSAAIIRTMGLGRPQIITDLPQFREIPDDCCWKLDLDGLEEDLLVAYLLELAGDERLRRAMGDNAKEFVLRHHSLEEAASGYMDLIETLAAEREKPLAAGRDGGLRKMVSGAGSAVGGEPQ